MERVPRLTAWVAAGGALGASARWSVALALGEEALATLLVNALGSALIGLLAALSLPGGRLPLSSAQRHFAMTGVCGGFTTFSLFSLDMAGMLAGGPVARAMGWLALSVLLWVIGVWAGYLAGTWLNARPRG